MNGRKVWHFASDWRWIRSDGPDGRIQAWIWIYFLFFLFFPVMLTHPHNNLSCSLFPLSYFAYSWGDGALSCKEVCPTTQPHPKSSLDSLKGHKGMDGSFFFNPPPLHVSMVIFFLLCVFDEVSGSSCTFFCLRVKAIWPHLFEKIFQFTKALFRRLDAAFGFPWIQRLSRSVL